MSTKCAKKGSYNSKTTGVASALSLDNNTATVRMYIKLFNIRSIPGNSSLTSDELTPVSGLRQGAWVCDIG